MRYRLPIPTLTAVLTFTNLRGNVARNNRDLARVAVTFDHGAEQTVRAPVKRRNRSEFRKPHRCGACGGPHNRSNRACPAREENKP